MSTIGGAISLPHTITVEAYRGTSGYGVALYAAPVSLACMLDVGSQLVRNANGDQVVSSTRAYCGRGQAIMPPSSRVTLPDGTVTTIISVMDHNSGRGWPTPDHLEIALT